MANVDLHGMSLDELKKLQKDVTHAIETFRDRQRDEARAALEERAREMGFTLSEVVSPSKRRRTPMSPPKYRNPANPDQTWTGRGRRPRWIDEALKAGKDLEEFAI